MCGVPLFSQPGQQSAATATLFYCGGLTEFIYDGGARRAWWQESCERRCGSVVALAVARLPASDRSPVIATLVSHWVLRSLCVSVRVYGDVRVS